MAHFQLGRDMDGINGIAGITGIVGFGLLGTFQLLVGINILFIKDIGILAVISALIFYFCCFIGVSCALRKKMLQRT